MIYWDDAVGGLEYRLQAEDQKLEHFQLKAGLQTLTDIPLHIIEYELGRFLFAVGITLFILISYAPSGNDFSLSVLLTQSPTATLSGTAVDENSAVLPDTNITLTNVETGFRRQVTTNGQGYFAISLLPPGHYTVLIVDHRTARWPLHPMT